MSTTTTPLRARYQPTAEECRRGGQAAAAKLTREQRRAGGLCRSRQPSFRDLQRRRGRKGAAVVLARYGPAERGMRNAERGTRRPGNHAGLGRLPRSAFRLWHTPYLLTLTDTEIRQTPDLARLAIQIVLVDPWPCRSWSAERGTRNAGIGEEVPAP